MSREVRPLAALDACARLLPCGERVAGYVMQRCLDTLTSRSQTPDS